MSTLNFRIEVRGLEESSATELGSTIATIVKELQPDLDFRRMQRIIVTTDFAGALADLSQAIPERPITYTNEEYGRAVAKVILLPFEDDYEIVPVIDANITSSLITPIGEGCSEADRAEVIHYLHHEFCHVHDNNKKVDLLLKVIFTAYTGKQMFTGPLAEDAWSEYFANRASSYSAPDTAVAEIVNSFKDALLRTKSTIDDVILDYRWHADLNELMSLFARHGGFLVKVAAYTLGYIDGLETSLEKLSGETHELLAGSYFRPTWESMRTALRRMYELYPERWEGLEVYDELESAIENYYAAMGLVLSNTDAGGAFVHVPFRPETTP